MIEMGMSIFPAKAAQEFPEFPILYAIKKKEKEKLLQKGCIWAIIRQRVFSA